MTGRDFKNMRGPYKGRTKDQYQKAYQLRRKGYSYRMISDELEIPWGTARNWVSDIQLDRLQTQILAQKHYRLKPFEKLTSTVAIRKRLIEERGNKCERCGESTWMGIPITIEIHHVDGKDNTRENLQLLCPNCHSQTDDYRNKKPCQSGVTGRRGGLKNRCSRERVGSTPTFDTEGVTL